nr:3-deoxy-7-phosphoheptulonate synthase [Maliibacterium massiliense]
MIVIMKQDATARQTDSVIQELLHNGLQVQVNTGTQCTVLGVLGDTQQVHREQLTMFPGVERVMRVQEPYKKANRKFHPEDTVVQVGAARVGGGGLTIIAGPCSVESGEQICSVARDVKAAGATMLRGGAFKPRTSPYAFQGMEWEGLELLDQAREETGLPVVSELMSPNHLELFEKMVDVIQIGARNMQNFDLLKLVGQSRKPILLKRGMSATIEEWLMSAEYIMAAGNPNVILCERGIRTFETYTRNTLDLSAIPAVKRLSHLPVVVDPSHACGMSWMVEPMAIAAVAAGADGLIIEVHNDPKKALCDGAQSITPEQFAALTPKLHSIASVMGKTMEVQAS